MSIFGGSGWQWDTRRRQYYLHNFLVEQPDLNFHNLEVQDALLETMQFWLNRGVDGFRLDTVNFYFHDANLRDNPPNIDSLKKASIDRSHSTYDHQHHFYDKSQPENIGWLNRMRKLCDEYNAILLGEVGCEWQIERMVEYTTGDDRLHTAYSFSLFGPEHDAAFIQKQLKPFVEKQGETWPCWATSNHDVKRLASRWLNGGQAHASKLSLESYALMLCTMLGTPCIYQGEELGMTEADLAFEDLVDPPGITFWPEYKGRDGCRTPMLWNANEPFAGFSNAKPWLPVPADHIALAVNNAESSKDSLLSFYKKLLKWRKANPVASRGEFSFIDTVSDVLAFKRKLDKATMTVVINMSDKSQAAIVAQGDLVFGQPNTHLQPGEYQLYLDV
jgi:alpha-glucosidase